MGGELLPCNDAPLYCLSDGVPREDWLWLARQESYKIPTPSFIDGFAMVQNHASLLKEVESFCEKREYFGAALMRELTVGGLNASVQLYLEDAPSFALAKCLVVTNLASYSEDEKRYLALAKLPILAVGKDVDLPLEKRGYYIGKYVSAALYGDCPTVDFSSLSQLDEVIEPGGVRFGEIWTEPLSYKRMCAEFFRELAKIINASFMLDRCDTGDLKVNSFVSLGEKYVLLSNDRHTYYLPTVRTEREIESAEAMMKEEGYKVRVSGNSFTVRIPPRCAEIVKIKYK